MSIYVAVDMKTGCYLRSATPEETEAYLSQVVRHASFRKPVQVGNVLVDEDTGPGASYIPGRFLKGGR